MRAPVTALLIGSCLALAACGSSDDGKDKSSSSSGSSAATSSTEAATGAGGCKRVAQPDPKGEQNLAAPSAKLKQSKTYTVTFATNCGSFSIRLDQRHDPKTAASFASLVRKGFYDGLTFHRIVAGFVIQGGDPLGNGQGGPGYSVVERPPSDTRYTRGVVAMAKTAAERPGTSGSQFFVVTGDDVGLPPEYAVAGKVSAGMSTVLRIGALPAPDPENVPTEPVVIAKATLSEG
jgi:cyclophilin family peptidyl-prolyl cis-trans isomerase